MTSPEAQESGGDQEGDLTTAPQHGRAGRGAASILPHLNRQQRINDKPAPAGDAEDMPRSAPPAAD